MRFESSSLPPVAPSWRWILWAASLAPALLLVSWSIREARRSNDTNLFPGGSRDEARRLQQILKEPHAATSDSLRQDAVRVLPTPSPSGVERSLFAAVQDNTFGVPAAEKPAYDEILERLRTTSNIDLEALALSKIPFAVLMLDADQYRGKALTVEGDLRRLNPLPADRTTSGNVETFEAWLFADDSGLNPYRVVLTALPQGIQPTGIIDPPLRVTVTGFFFKRYSYATANDFHTAPLILAKTLTRRPGQASVRTSHQHSPIRQLTWFAAGILAMVGIAWLFVTRPKRRGTTALDVGHGGKTPDFGWLTPPADDSVSKNDSLR